MKNSYGESVGDSSKYEKITTLKLNEIDVVYGVTAIGEMKQRGRTNFFQLLIRKKIMK